MQRLSRSSLVWLVVLALSVLSVPTVLARDMGRPAGSAVDAAGELEVALWGQTKSGAVAERAAALEGALFGKVEEGPVLARLDRLREYLLPGREQSVVTRLSSLELALFAKVSVRPLSERLGRIEQELAGRPQEGPILERIAVDLKTVGLSQLNVARRAIPAGLPVRVRFLDAVRTDEAKVDQVLAYEVVNSVAAGGVTVIAAGTRGTAHVVSTRKAGPLGRDGRLELDFCTVTAVDGSLAPVTARESVFTPGRGDRSRAFAAGAGMAGVILMGPVGAAGSALVRGQEVEFAPGSELDLVTASGPEVNVLGK